MVFAHRADGHYRPKQKASLLDTSDLDIISRDLAEQTRRQTSIEHFGLLADTIGLDKEIRAGFYF